MKPFTYTGLPARVVFGRGTTACLPEEAGRLGIRRALVLTTPPQAAEGRKLAELMGDCAAGVFTGATMHTPVEVTERAMAAFAEAAADGIVALGGGSSVGLGKAIALRTDAPQVVLPTTYAGSEMTPILGQTAEGRKTTLRSPKVLPETVIYDVDYTVSLPPALTLTSGMNAIAHAVEALYAEEANPVLSLMAEQGVASMVGALPRVLAAPGDLDARSDALYGAWLCAVCLGSGGVALHHKLCHVLGGMFDLPHAETHCAVLPHALAYNAPAATEAVAVLCRATASDRPWVALYEIAAAGGASMALRDLGMPRGAVDEAIAATLQSPYPNPRPLEAGPLRALLLDAWEGRAPRPA